MGIYCIFIPDFFAKKAKIIAAGNSNLSELLYQIENEIENVLQLQAKLDAYQEIACTIKDM